MNKTDMKAEIGDVLDAWEQLSNDIRTDPGFEQLNNAIIQLYLLVAGRAKNRPNKKVLTAEEWGDIIDGIL